MAQKRKILHDVFVVDGSRSPFLKAKGKPGPFTAANLAVSTARPLLARMPFDATAIDEVILGCVMPGPDEANIARVAALRLGCDQHMHRATQLCFRVTGPGQCGAKHSHGTFQPGAGWWCGSHEPCSRTIS